MGTTVSIIPSISTMGSADAVIRRKYVAGKDIHGGLGRNGALG